MTAETKQERVFGLVNRVPSAAPLTEVEITTNSTNGEKSADSSAIYGRPFEPRRRLSVLGSGDFGTAFALRAAQNGYLVTIGSRNPENRRFQLDNVDSICWKSVDEAMADNDLLILCIPSAFYETLPLEKLVDKVIVDVSNVVSSCQINSSFPSNAEKLQALVPHSHVVKAFNVLSAHALSTQQQDRKQVFMAGDSTVAKQKIVQLVSDMGYTPIDLGPLKMARAIEKKPHELFNMWRAPCWITSAIFLFFWTFSLFKFQICQNISTNRPWHFHVLRNMLMVNFNRASAITAINNLAITYLPGCIAGYVQLVRGTKYMRFPSWLHQWLLMRKQLGLIALGLAALHSVISMAMSSPFYLTMAYEMPSKLVVQLSVNGSFLEQEISVLNTYRQDRAEFGLSLGAISLLMLVMIGICSLPSVAGALSWREFQFIQSGLGWSTLATALLHNIVLGWDLMILEYTCHTPSPLQVGMYLPIVALLTKTTLRLPPLAGRLAAIRSGRKQ